MDRVEQRAEECLPKIDVGLAQQRQVEPHSQPEVSSSLISTQLIKHEIMAQSVHSNPQSALSKPIANGDESLIDSNSDDELESEEEDMGSSSCVKGNGESQTSLLVVQQAPRYAPLLSAVRS